MKQLLLALALLTTAATGNVAQRFVVIEVVAYRNGTPVSRPTVAMPAEPVNGYNASVGLRDGDRPRLRMDLRLAGVNAKGAEVDVRYSSFRGATEAGESTTRVKLPWGEAQPLTPPANQRSAGRTLEITATRVDREALNARTPGAGPKGKSPCEDP